MERLKTGLIRIADNGKHSIIKRINMRMGQSGNHFDVNLLDESGATIYSKTNEEVPSTNGRNMSFYVGAEQNLYRYKLNLETMVIHQLRGYTLRSTNIGKKPDDSNTAKAITYANQIIKSLEQRIRALEARVSKLSPNMEKSWNKLADRCELYADVGRSVFTELLKEGEEVLAQEVNLYEQTYTLGINPGFDAEADLVGRMQMPRGNVITLPDSYKSMICVWVDGNQVPLVSHKDVMRDDENLCLRDYRMDTI